jgi:hypothetical protein
MGSALEQQHAEKIFDVFTRLHGLVNKPPAQGPQITHDRGRSGRLWIIQQFVKHEMAN